MLTLETERLSLRGFSTQDWDALSAIISDPEVTRFMHFAAWDEAKRREWFTRLVQDGENQKRSNWAITLRSNGMLIGWFFIGGAEEGPRGCGYALARHFWGQGYMPEAARAIFAYEFTALGASRIIAECEVQNTASARVMQKSGMTYEETSYNADFEGNWAMRHCYAISKQDWEVASRAKK
ncbi:MAG: GNAT family N-acetyltransferase [Ktedonobacteraceae bacterium]|nr:GNAT family N-acetyltransferase [Ktedonobacteraceae bacterium]